VWIIPPTRYTPSQWSGLPDKQAVRVWYHLDADGQQVFDAWFDARALAEARWNRRVAVEEAVSTATTAHAKRFGDAPMSVELQQRVDALQVEIAEMTDAEDTRPSTWDAYAEGLGPALSYLEISGGRVPWPDDPGGRKTILRQLGAHVCGDIARAVRRGAYDDDLVGKS